MPYRPDFCLRAEAEPLETAEALLANDRRVAVLERARRRLWLRGPEEEVLRVVPRRLQDVHALATELRRRTRTKGYLFFDVDHQPESRWMHENGVFSMGRLRVGPAGPEWALAEGEDRWTLDYPTPDLRTARLEVRARRAGPEASFDDPLESVRLGERTLTVARVGDPAAERRVLLALGRALHRLDPDVLVTHHGDRWDLPYLLRRLHALGLADRVRLGRDPDPSPERPDQEAKSIHTYGRWLFKTHAYYLRGRWHVDLSKKTLDADDDRKDLHGIVYMARVANRRAQDVNRNGAGYALQQMQIDEAVSRGVALPWKRNLAEDWKDAATLCAVDRGGQIMVPTPGLYEDVAALDFSGYYPSIVVRHNLSSDTINCACCPDGELVPELNYHVCRREGGHQADILARLMPHRRRVKALLRRAATVGGVDPDLVAKAKAIKAEQKALGVVCFGYFRYRNARFGCAEVHQAIQCYGRQGMGRARELAEAMGFTVVHTLTDCIFLQRPGATRRDAQRVARRVGQDLGLPMDVEGVYRWLVLLPSKSHSAPGAAAGPDGEGVVGVPNRYYGLFEDGTLKVRGIEVQRHSTPGWVYDAQQAMLDVFARCRDAAAFRAALPEALAKVREAATALRRGAVDPKELGVMVQATRGVEDYAANTNTRHALRRLEGEGIRREAGEYVKYVVTRATGPGPQRALPVELLGREGPMGGGVAPHVDSYLRLLARSVETLLGPFGYAEERVLAWLRGTAASPLAPAQRRLAARERPPFVSR